MITDYKGYAKRLAMSGEGVERDEECETHNPVQYMRFYIASTGPDEETTAEAFNIWGASSHLCLLLSCLCASSRSDC